MDPEGKLTLCTYINLINILCTYFTLEISRGLGWAVRAVNRQQGTRYGSYRAYKECRQFSFIFDEPNEFVWR
jgi:hypothetical protein